MSKEISFGADARAKIKAGIDKAFHSVAPTLGAVGMTAMIESPGLDPIECDDGVTILRQLEFKDPYEQIGLLKLRKAAIRTSEEAGDGTATTATVTHALVNEAFKEIKHDSSKIREVKERLEAGMIETIDTLRAMKREAITDEDIARIARISSLDDEVATLITETIKEVGVNGIITVERGSKIGYEKEVVKGARFEKGLITQYLVNDFENEQCVLENPYIVLIDRKVSLGTQVTSIMKSIADSGNKSVLFIADDVDSLALASLIQANKTIATVQTDGTQKQGTYDIGIVRNPYTASPARDFLLDMAALTGATVISEEAGMRLDLATVKECGVADKVIITKTDCTIIGGHGQEEALKTRIAAIEKQIDETTSDYVKIRMKDRLACLTGGIGVIKVGTYTDTEFNAKKYKFDNAIKSTQAALQEGILPGGGVALFDAVKYIKEPMFRNALPAPFRQQMLNAGLQRIDSSLTNNITERGVDGIGINFKTKEMVNMFDAGIIDPFKVTRLAIESATAIAISLVTTEVAIVTEKDETKEH